MNFPSTSISSMDTFPVAEAEWEMVTLLLASDSSTSILFLLPPAMRTLRLDEARETVTREEGLGDSFSLEWGREKTHTHITSQKRRLREGPPCSPQLPGRRVKQDGSQALLAGNAGWSERRLKLGQGCCTLGIRRSFFTEKAARLCPGKWWNHLEVLETHMDVAPGDMV